MKRKLLVLFLGLSSVFWGKLPFAAENTGDQDCFEEFTDFEDIVNCLKEENSDPPSGDPSNPLIIEPLSPQVHNDPENPVPFPSAPLMPSPGVAT